MDAVVVIVDCMHLCTCIDSLGFIILTFYLFILLNYGSFVCLYCVFLIYVLLVFLAPCRPGIIRIDVMQGDQSLVFMLVLYYSIL